MTRADDIRPRSGEQDHLAWSRGVVDPALAEKIDTLVRDSFGLSSRAFLAECPEALGPARRAAEAADEAGTEPFGGSPAFEAAMDELESFREHARRVQDEAIGREYDDGWDDVDQLNPGVEQKPSFPLFDAALAGATDRAADGGKGAARSGDAPPIIRVVALEDRLRELRAQLESAGLDPDAAGPDEGEPASAPALDHLPQPGASTGGYHEPTPQQAAPGAARPQDGEPRKTR